MGDKDLLVEMGFNSKLVDQALKMTKNSGLQPALDWLEANPNGVDEQTTTQEVDDGEITAEQATAQSLKCDDCGKILRDGAAAEFHAVKTNHVNFSESTEAIKPLTAEEKAEKLKQLQERLAARREQKRLEEIEEGKKREKVRRTTGSEMQLIKEKLEQEKVVKEAELRRREKEEERLAKERVKQQLEADKRERQREAEERKLRQQGIAPKPATPPSVPIVASTNYDETRIQIRIPNAAPVTKVFSAQDTLQSILDFCKQNYSNPFKLFQTFPRKELGAADSQKTLKDLGLVPSAALILQ